MTPWTSSTPTAVLLAGGGASWEAELAVTLDRNLPGIRLVRRCLDLADLLATAASGTARVALVSADLRRLDRDAVHRLREQGLAVVGVLASSDETAERQLRQCGIDLVVPAGASDDDLTTAIAVAASGAGAPVEDVADTAALDDAGDYSGRLVAVWGPAGAPGRTTVAVNLAAELAASAGGALIADADTYGASVAQLLGTLDEAPGLAAAARQANSGALDLPGLSRLAAGVAPGLRLLAGPARAGRWIELKPSALAEVWRLSRGLSPWTVVDCGFCLEQDEALVYDTSAQQRNGATLSALEDADVVVAVGSADPVGLARLTRGLADLREVVADTEIRVVVNRVRSSVLGSDPQGQVRQALARHAGVSAVVCIPEDRSAVDASVRRGRTLSEVSPRSSARSAIASLAASLVDPRGSAPSRRFRRAG